MSPINNAFSAGLSRGGRRAAWGVAIVGAVSTILAKESERKPAVDLWILKPPH
jgi:hypothetical protein